MAKKKKKKLEIAEKKDEAPVIPEVLKRTKECDYKPFLKANVR